ncbi:MAG: MmcB family DNA repair protein [Roseovarius sp.]|nr:MmcB family DNA repair protein [Roseovarius sp.]MCY4291649.1 MmcB family DNA repair protein [Roseovarius sp.]
MIDQNYHSQSNGQQTGRLLMRGVCRYLRSCNYATIDEFAPAKGRRVDVMALGPKGELWIVECKSGRADFMSDNKWHEYLDWCDGYFWAVDLEFPVDLLPEHTGIMIADSYGAEIIRMASRRKLSAARRNVLVRKFARHAAMRLQMHIDPKL